MLVALPSPQRYQSLFLCDLLTIHLNLIRVNNDSDSGTFQEDTHDYEIAMDIHAVADNAIAQQAKQGLPIILPWGRQCIRLGPTYHSRLQGTANPWSDETPFVLSDLHIIPKELHAEFGTTTTFKKVKTTRESETGDHLSLGFGIGVGLPFLASVSVKGTFDQHIQENKDVSYSSC